MSFLAISIIVLTIWICILQHRITKHIKNDDCHTGLDKKALLNATHDMAVRALCEASKKNITKKDEDSIVKNRYYLVEYNKKGQSIYAFEPIEEENLGDFTKQILNRSLTDSLKIITKRRF